MNRENALMDRQPSRVGLAGQYRQGGDVGAVMAEKTVASLEPQLPEVPRALSRAFELSDALSGEIARLDCKIRPILRPSAPSPDTKIVESMTEMGGAIDQLIGHMELMLSAVASMIHRAEV